MDTHLLPATINGIPEQLPAPLDTQELWAEGGAAGGRSLQRLDSLDVLQQQYGSSAAAGRAALAGGVGGFRPLGQLPAGIANSRAAGRYSNGSRGADFGGQQEEAASATAAQQRQGRGRPNLSISTRKPPGSPVILRGDHLPSPTRGKQSSIKKPAARARAAVQQR